MKGRNVQFMGERGAAGPLTGNKMTTFSESHKTVFVVDHCPYMSESVGSTWSLICSLRTALRIIPLAPISKSLYTCAIEASLEYSRIMYNIFPFRKLVSDSGSRSLNSWNQEDQNVQEGRASRGTSWRFWFGRMSYSERVMDCVMACSSKPLFKTSAVK
ncbi:integrator complex subunit 13 isoform X2 [Xenopus laevis]|uniref:Integrator complex subunit 13 isoform X2 n=1 Tax=Xenopus laevis TaxID=8355 RepID=A0A8J1MJ08_XENLA|nr:integrator complex subunit 13 isoform X2 [Xenopus laevis]